MSWHFVLDTSVVLLHFTDCSPFEIKQSNELIRLAYEGKAILYFPNVCMAECSKRIAEIAFDSTQDSEKAKEKYNQHIQKLLGMISKYKTTSYIHCLNVKRDHFVNIEEIFESDHLSSNREKRRRLSGVDALVIKCAQKIARAHKEKVRILCKEKQLVHVCNQNPHLFPKAIDISKDFIPDSH